MYICTELQTPIYIEDGVLHSIKSTFFNICMCQRGSEVERQGKSTTPRTALSFPSEKEELPWVGFEPTTLCSLGERSTT